MPLVWFPTLLWCGFNDAPFWAMFWTVVLGYAEYGIRKMYDLLTRIDLDDLYCFHASILYSMYESKPSGDYYVIKGSKDGS